MWKFMKKLFKNNKKVEFTRFKDDGIDSESDTEGENWYELEDYPPIENIPKIWVPGTGKYWDDPDAAYSKDIYKKVCDWIPSNGMKRTEVPYNEFDFFDNLVEEPNEPEARISGEGFDVKPLGYYARIDKWVENSSKIENPDCHYDIEEFNEEYARLENWEEMEEFIEDEW